jgi:hypothetical protein
MSTVPASPQKPSDFPTQPPSYPFACLAHWHGVTRWQVSWAKKQLADYHAPTVEAEELRLVYLTMLTECHELLRETLPVHLSEALAQEEAARDLQQPTPTPRLPRGQRRRRQVRKGGAR